jgi:hypothetical protein
MDTDASDTETTSNKETVPGKTGRPPAIILTSTTYLIQLQKKLKSVVKKTLSSVALKRNQNHHDRHGGFLIREIPPRRH